MMMMMMMMMRMMMRMEGGRRGCDTVVGAIYRDKNRT
jgi:hypothetical protein